MNSGGREAGPSSRLIPGIRPPADLPTIRLTGIRKQFGSLIALDSVDVDFFAGEIHAIVGENGAGKSTLMNIIAGFERPSSGDGLYLGKRFSFGDVQAIRRSGIAMVHQHFMLVPELSVLKNIELASLLVGRMTRSDFQSVAGALGWNLEWDRPVRELSVSAQQKVEIVKGLVGNTEVLILDEPTAVLSEAETGELFSVLRRLAAEGKTIIVIVHKLDEVMEIADRITVLRRGVHQSTTRRGELGRDELIHQMIGKSLGHPQARPGAAGEALVEIEDLFASGDRGEIAVSGVTFPVHRGEILGIGGVDQNGQLELAECLAGIRKVRSGSIRKAGDPSIAYIPSDRQRDAVARTLSIRDNLLIAALGSPDLRTRDRLKLREIGIWASRLMAQFQIKAPHPGVKLGALSGGNQQKVVLARCLSAGPDLIIACNPTRGLDVGMTEFVHGELRASADRGAAVVLFSTDRDELGALADRTLFMSRGKLHSSEVEALA